MTFEATLLNKVPNMNSAKKQATGLALIFLTVGIVYEMQSQIQSSRMIEAKKLSESKSVSDIWVREELAERGWTREQLAAKDREYKKHIDSKRLMGIE